MNRINVTIHLKPFDDLNDEDIINLSEHMNRSKGDLMSFVSYYADKATYNLMNDFISDQEDVEKFVTNYFSGDYDGLLNDAECFVADRYAELV